MARVNGYLQQVAYTPGEIVKKGQLLFVIEPSQYEDAVEQAEAALKTAQAQYDYAENNYTRMKEAAKRCHQYDRFDTGGVEIGTK